MRRCMTHSKALPRGAQIDVNTIPAPITGTANSMAHTRTIC